jgi:hypothetical protein
MTLRTIIAALATWAMLQGAMAASTAPSPPPAAPYQLVGTRAGAHGFSLNVTTGLQRWNQRSQHWAPYGARSLRLILPGWAPIASAQPFRGDQAIANSILYMTSATVVSGGSQYSVGDILVMPVWGAGFEPALLYVDAVAAGVITKVHVLRGGAYQLTTPLADGTGQMAVWQATFGYGAYSESQGFTGSNLNGYNLSNLNGGARYVAANTFISVASGPACTGGTISATVDSAVSAINSTPPAGTWTCTDTTHMNAVYAISSGATLGGLGSGATFNFTWQGAAYLARVSVDPVWTDETCSNQLTGVCVHVPATASSPYPNAGPDALGNTMDIYVPSGADVVTDPIPINIAPGASFGIRTFVFGSVPQSRMTVTNGEGQATASFTNYDKTMFSSFGQGAVTSPAGMLEFVGILGQPTVAGPTPSLLSITDSRGAGTIGFANTSGFDVYDYTGGSQGWLERAVNNTMPIVAYNHSGDAIYYWQRNHQMHLDGLKKVAGFGKFPELCYQGMSINDENQLALSFATVAASEAQLVKELRGLGCKFVFATTDDPVASVSDTNHGIIWADINTPGSGYGANQTFTVTVAGGTFTTAATATVTTDSGGAVRQVNDITNGAYTADPTTTANVVTGGSGTNLKLNLYMSSFGNPATQTPNGVANPTLQLRNAALRQLVSAGTGTYAGVYDGVLDFAGITETSIASGVWTPFCTADGLHASVKCQIAKANYARPIIAGWAARAYGMR